MKTESIEYQDGTVTLRGFLAYDDRKSGKRPGILVMPEAFGLGTHAKERAERLANLGYVAEVLTVVWGEEAALSGPL